MNQHLGTLAGAGAAFALAAGVYGLLFAQFAGHREHVPHLLALAASFVACALVVAIRSALRARLEAQAIEPPPSGHPVKITVGVLVLGTASLWGAAVLAPPAFNQDGAVPWASLLVVWLSALSVALPAARWCRKAARLLQTAPRTF